MRANRIVCVCVSVLYFALITTMAYAVATKKLTINNTAGKKLRIQAQTPSGPVDVKPEQEDNNNRVAAFIPVDAERVTITDESTGKSAELSGPFTFERTVEFSSLPFVAVGATPATAAAAGGAAAMAQRTTAGGNWFNSWVKEMGLREVRFIAAGGAGLSTGNVWGNARSDLGSFGTFQGMSDFGQLSGGLAKVGIELVVPDVWGFENIIFGLTGDIFFGRSSTGRADLDPFSSGAEATQKHKVTDAINVYIGKQKDFQCPVGWETCYVSAKVGGSVVNTVDKLTILEAGVEQSFKDCTRQIAPYWAVGLGIPAVNLGAGAVGYVYVDFAFRYVPSTQYDHRSRLGFQYQNRTDAYVDFNPTIGIGVAFDP